MNSQNTQNTTNVQSLFATAAQADTLSPAGLNVLQAPDLGATIQAALGTSVDDVTASEVTLIGVLLDDSGSIASGNNEQNIRDGVNLILDSLGKTKAQDGILMTASVLNNKTPIYPFVTLSNAIRLDSNNFNASGYTPLYDRTIDMCGLMVAKSQEFSNSGVPCRGILLIVTDGADAGSHKRAQDVLPLVKDLLRQETFIVCGMGIDDNGHTDFRKVFRNMGIEDKWILTPSNSPSEIRKAFAFASQSAVRASQAAAAFSQVQAGGFGGTP